MPNKTDKIRKANIFHSIRYKTLPIKTGLRYCISLFIAGLFFIAVSSRINSNIIQSTLQIISTFLFTVSIYLFPFLEFEKVDKFLNQFLKYIGLLLLSMVYSIFWFALCSLGTNSYALFFVIPSSIIEIVIIVPFINFTIKPIIEIVAKISSEIKERSKNNGENPSMTYIKSFCANISVIISFILTLITFFTTINSIFHPLEMIDKIFTK